MMVDAREPWVISYQGDLIKDNSELCRLNILTQIFNEIEDDGETKRVLEYLSARYIGCHAAPPTGEAENG